VSPVVFGVTLLVLGAGDTFTIGFGVERAADLGVTLTGAVVVFGVETFRSDACVPVLATFAAGVFFIGVDLENPVGLGKNGEEDRLVELDFAGDKGPIGCF